jgi:hypothetical protein
VIILLLKLEILSTLLELIPVLLTSHRTVPEVGYPLYRHNVSEDGEKAKEPESLTVNRIQVTYGYPVELGL